MPPEPYSCWDRRDFRKHDRSGSEPRFAAAAAAGGFPGGGGGGPHRWRDRRHHPHAPPPPPPPPPQRPSYHNHQRRYSDFRSSRPLPPGHGKQGGWHMYPDEAGPGFMPFGSRYGDRNIEEENSRPFGSRGDGRYFKSSRENRGSFSQKDWKAPLREPAASQRGPGRPTPEVNNQRSTEDNQDSHQNDSNNYSNRPGRPTPEVNNLRSAEDNQDSHQDDSNNYSNNNDNSHPFPDSVNPSDQSQSLVKEHPSDQAQSPLKDQHEKKDGGATDGQTSLDHKLQRENSLASIDLKPLKWTRSGSLSSRGSGFSHSSSSKSMGVDSVEVMAEVQQKNVTPVQSPATTACLMSSAPAPSDETSSRKKLRLGWGEGLAKYEKKKVEGPEDGAPKTVSAIGSNEETMQTHFGNLLDKSPGVANLVDCASPATPSSVACSSSPGIEEKDPPTKAANGDHDTANLSCSPSVMSQAHYDGPLFNLENLECTSFANLSSLINELLQSDDPSYAETGYGRTASLNKLLVWKVNILKAVEVTESKIDSLETELKSLASEPGSSCPHQAASTSLPGDWHSRPSELATDSDCTVRPAPLQVVSSEDLVGKTTPLEDVDVESKDGEIDSPGSATSKFVEVLPSGENGFSSETAEYVEVNLGSNDCCNSDQQCLKNLNEVENTCKVDGCNAIATHCECSSSVGNMLFIDVVDDQLTLASNKDFANRIMEEFNKLLPTKQSVVDISTAFHASPLQTNSLVIKERFLKRKRFVQFKEKVLALKFKVFQHFWKEGRVVSVRKLRAKSHKKFDLSRTGFKKNRSSSRSRISFSAGSSRAVPAEEVIEFVNWLLSDALFKPYRNSLKMPTLVLDKEKRMSRFISHNGLVEDPCALEKEKSIINPWTADERELFIDKLATFGKDFKKIASFLDHKTTADCVEFYYKNHKSECFERARKKPDFAMQRKSQSNKYLVASGKRWNRESNAVSLDILGAASAIAANADDGSEIQQKCTSRIFFGASSSYKAPRGDGGPLQRSSSLDMYSSETVAADVLAGICGSLSSEAMSSCITSSIDLGDGCQDRRSQRFGSSTKRPLTPEVTQNVDDQCSDESCGEMDPTDWTDRERTVFLEAVTSRGKDFAMISQCVGTKSIDQCKIFFSKARKCLGLDLIQPRASNAVSGDCNGGDSDIEDAYLLEAGSSVICNNGSGCKLEEDLPPPDAKLSEKSDTLGRQFLKPGPKTCNENDGPCPLDPMIVEPIIKDPLMADTQVDDKPVVDLDVYRKAQNGACASARESGTLVSYAESGRVEDADEHGMPNGSSEAESKAVVEVSGMHLLAESRGELLSPENNLDSQRVDDTDASSSEVALITCASSKRDSKPQMAEDISHSAFVRSSVKIDNVCDSRSTEDSCVSSLGQNGRLASMESSTLFSVPIKYQEQSTSNDLLSVAANGILRDKQQSQKIVMAGDPQQHILCYSRSNHSVESSQILRGYPVSVQTMKELHGDVNSKKTVPVNAVRRDGIVHSDRHTEFSLQKCSAPKHQSRVVESPTIQPQGQHSCPQHDADKPSSRNGHVKLFGKILVSSSQEKPAKSSIQETGGAGCQSLGMKFSGSDKVNLDSSHCNKYVGSTENNNIPVRNYGFWDGNRSQMGFPPLPDSSLLLTKYPTAFGNYPSGPAVKLETKHHQELTPFTIDMKQQKQPQDLSSSEIQRRNGFDVVSTIQQRGINVVGGGGVFGAAQYSSSGVSDPVAAIKMHYANAENFMKENRV